MKNRSAKGRIKSKRQNRRHNFFSEGKREGNFFFQRKKNTIGEVPAIQRDMPSIALPRGQAIPNLPGLTQRSRRALLERIEHYQNTPTQECGQLAVNAITNYLEQIGTVNYSQNDRVKEGSPIFRLRPGFAAIRAGASSTTAGITYESGGKIQIDIFPKAIIGESETEKLGFLTGVIVHEYIHVLQNMAPDNARRTQAEREFQAWLWQAQHLDQLDIEPRSVASRQIGVQLSNYFDQLSLADRNAQRNTFIAARQNLNRQRSQANRL